MNFKKSWDIYFQKVLDDDFLKFMEHEFQNFNEICFFQLIYICDKKAGEKNTQLKKHLLFLFKVYNSPIKIHGP